MSTSRNTEHRGAHYGGLLGEIPPEALPEAVGRRVALNLVSRPLGDREIHYAHACTWSGALKLAGAVGDDGLLVQLLERFEPIFGEGGSRWIPSRPHVDDRVFGIVPLEAVRRSADRRFRELGLRLADEQWQTTTPDGITTEARYWTDDMFMITALQLQAWRATGWGKYLDRAALTMSAYLAKLQRPNGLFLHTCTSPVFWGRGNGWVASGMALALECLPEAHPKRAEILSAYRAMMWTLLDYQSSDGSWRQLVDVPEAWPEMSSTGMFAFAMAAGLRKRWLDASVYLPAARKAWLALVEHLDARGNLSSVCPGTGDACQHVGADPDAQRRYYLERPRETGDYHGQAPLLWTATALLQR